MKQAIEVLENAIKNNARDADIAKENIKDLEQRLEWERKALTQFEAKAVDLNNALNALEINDENI